MNVLGNRQSIGQMTAYDLIEQLNKQYPPRCMTPDENLQIHQRYAGKRDLIDGLLARLKQEES